MHKQNGFTLIELMIASLIGLIIMGGLMNLFITTNRSVALSSALAQNQEIGRFTMEYLTRYIRRAGYSDDFGHVSNVPPLFMISNLNDLETAVTCTAGTDQADACSANNPAGIRGDRLSIPFLVGPGQNVLSCTGTNLAGGVTTPVYYVSVFFVSDATAHKRELRCHTYNRTANAWADAETSIINNVERMEFQVGVALTGNKYTERYINIANMVAAVPTISPADIRSIRVAILTTSKDEEKIHTTQKVRKYHLLDFDIPAFAADGNLRNIFSNTIELPNMIEGQGT